jgi:hypothetical protein
MANTETAPGIESWNRERTPDELQSFLTRKLMGNIALDAVEIE